MSDGASQGVREDTSGPALAGRLRELGFEVTVAVAPDDRARIASHVREAAARHVLVVATGGTGLGPRDVTPQALQDVLDYEIPGFGEQMRAAGLRSTPFAILSRSVAGVCGRSIVVAVPGSRGAALESIEALVPVLDHAIATAHGDTEHHPHGASEPDPDLAAVAPAPAPGAD